MLRRTAIAIATIFAITGTAHADWPASGKLVTTVFDSFNGVLMARVLELPSGEFYVLSVGNGGNSFGYSLQRLSPGGDISPGWPANGFVLGEVGKSESPIWQGFTVDDTCAFWRAGYSYYTPSRPYARLVRPEPLQYAPWPATGTTGFNLGAAAAPAPGGAYLAYAGRLQRMTRSGTVAPGWPANGVTTVVSSGVAIAADGSDGVVVFVTQAGAAPPLVKRFDPSGALHAGWPASGLQLSSDPNDQMTDVSPPKLVRSGADHFIAGWLTPYDSQEKKLKLQRFSLDGTLDPSWPATGVEAIAADTIVNVTLIPDDLGGAHALWIAYNRPYGTHIRSDGTFEPGLTASGVDLAAGDPSFRVPQAFLSLVPEVIADAATGGRLIFAYDDFFVGTPQYRVRWLLPDYTADPAEPMRTVNPAAGSRGVRLVHHDGAGGAYLGWETTATDEIPYADRGLWMTRVLSTSLVGVPTPPGDARLAFGRPSPNPARDAVTLAVTLPDDSPARLSLFDVAGREVRWLEVRGAGERSVRLDELDRLPAGLYLARMRHARGVVGTRLIVTR